MAAIETSRRTKASRLHPHALAVRVNGTVRSELSHAVDEAEAAFLVFGASASLQWAGSFAGCSALRSLSMPSRKWFKFLLALMTMAMLAGNSVAQHDQAAATVVVKVPDGAKVYVKGDKDETEMIVNKTTCRFTSGKLEPGKPGYFFIDRVKYSKGDQELAETRKVRVFAGNTTELDLSDIAVPSKKLRTYQHWCEVAIIGNEWMPKVKDPKPIEIARAMKQIASEIDGLPVRGVDEDAVAVSQDTSEVLGKIAKFIEENDGLGRGAEAFIRGIYGDPFGVAKEMAADQKALNEAIERVNAKRKKTRALLTARYDIEFTLEIPVMSQDSTGIPKASPKKYKVTVAKFVDGKWRPEPSLGYEGTDYSAAEAIYEKYRKGDWNAEWDAR